MSTPEIIQQNHALLITYTLFPDVWPKEKTERQDVPWGELVERIRSAPTYIDKAHCPLVSLSEYGDSIDSEHKCLRYAENVRRCFGVEFDYDLGLMPMATAARRLQEAGVQAVFYTSPSHTTEKPRWRILLPLGDPALPEKRAEYVGRANRVLGGIASRESFTLSQSFYIGRVRGAVYEVLETFGRTIDLAAEFEPLYYVGHDGNGRDHDPTTDEDLRAAFLRGENRYIAMRTLSARWAARGMSVSDIESSLDALLGSGSHNADGVDLRTRIRPLALSAVRKYGESRKKQEPPQPNGTQRKPEPVTDEEMKAAALSEVRSERPVSFSGVRAGTYAEPAALVENLLFPGAWLLVGRPKIGKSWLLLQLALAVAEGDTFLGYSCTAADVLCFFAEDTNARIQKRLNSLGVATAPENAFVYNRDDALIFAKRYAEHCSFIEFLDAQLQAQPNIKLVLIDTETVMRQIWYGEGGKNARVTEADYAQTRVYDELALRRNIVIILVNHAKKRNGDFFDIHELINRSNTALAGASGSISLADPPDADPFDTTSRLRVLGVRGRDLRDDVMLAVHQDQGRPVFVVDGPYMEVRENRVEDEALQALSELMSETEAGNYVACDDIATAIGRSNATVKVSLWRRIRKGKTLWRNYRLTAKRGKGGGYRLDPSHDNEQK